LITCLAENHNLAKEVENRLYQSQEEEEELPSTDQENPNDQLVLSQCSDDDFLGFENDSLLA
jgi:hypothetical protein